MCVPPQRQFSTLVSSFCSICHSQQALLQHRYTSCVQLPVLEGRDAAVIAGSASRGEPGGAGDRYWCVHRTDPPPPAARGSAGCTVLVELRP